MSKKLAQMSKEWWLKMAESEGDSEVGCGVTPDYLKDNGIDNAPTGERSPLVKKTGFDQYLEKQLQDPIFKRAYKAALKDIQEYDRKERKRLDQEKTSESPGKVGRGNKKRS